MTFSPMYCNIGPVLPAIGYQKVQLDALETTINRADVDLVIIATPADLTRLLHIEKKTIKAHYEFAEAGTPRVIRPPTRFSIDWLVPKRPAPMPN